VRVLRVVLHGLAQVTEQRAGEEVGALGEARHALVVDEGRGLGAATQLLEREGTLVKVAPGVRVAVERALAGAQAQPPGRAMGLPSRLFGRQRRVGLQLEVRRHRGQAVAPAEVGVAAVDLGQPGGDGQPVQADLAAGDAVRPRGVPQQPQVAGQQHGGLGRQHRAALVLDAVDPVAAGLVGARVARVFDRDHQRVRVRPIGPCSRRAESSTSARIMSSPAAKLLRLALFELGPQRRHARVAQRCLQAGGVGHGAGADQRGVEVQAGSLQVPRALGGVGADVGRHRVDRAFTHQVEHRHVARQCRRQRIGWRRVEVQRLHRRHPRQVGRGRLPPQPFAGIGPEVGRAVAVGEQAHVHDDSCPRGGRGPALASASMPSLRRPSRPVTRAQPLLATPSAGSVASISLQGISKHWDTATALAETTLDIAEGSFTVLLGPSGCGKSTTLRLIAGLEQPSSGRLLIGGRDVTALPPAERNIAMVFQNYALFPHLSVADNIVFGLQVRKAPRAEQQRRLHAGGRPGRPVGLLQRKPVAAVGRAAAARGAGPRAGVAGAGVPDGRAAVQPGRAAAPGDAPRTARAAAAAEADGGLRHARPGRGDEHGRPGGAAEQGPHRADRHAARAVRAAGHAFAARFIGTPPMNLAALHAGAVRGSDVPLNAPPGAAWLGLRPEAVSLLPVAGGLAVPARVQSLEYLGADAVLRCTVGDQTLTVRTAGSCAAAEGADVTLHWAATDSHWFGADERRIDP
jgi:sn-glycerol 3-phosphate transport system ATP-binding protein